MNSEYHDFVRKRIAELREKLGVSTYQMSYDLKRSKGYIHNIISGRALPSMAEFFAICDYLNISPRDFFDCECENPMLVREITEKARKTSSEGLIAVLSVLNVFGKDKGNENKA